MNSIILRTATRLLFTLLLLFSVFILLRGHNEPGGGFIAGLVTGGAFVLYAIAYDVAAAPRALAPAFAILLVDVAVAREAGIGVRVVGK